MADIDSNQHRVRRDFLREFQIVEVSSKLSVDLSEDVGSDR